MSDMPKLLEGKCVRGSMVDRTVSLYESCGHKLVKVDTTADGTQLTFDDEDKCWLVIQIDYVEKHMSAERVAKQLTLFDDPPLPYKSHRDGFIVPVPEDTV